MLATSRRPRQPEGTKMRKGTLSSMPLRRGSRWSCYAQQVVDAYDTFAGTRSPPDLVSGTLRTLLFAKCTSTRFHHTPEPCWLCGAGGMDRQGHYLGCPVVRAWLEDRFGWWTQLDDESMHAWLFLNMGRPQAESRQAATAMDAILVSYGMVRTRARMRC